MGCRPSNSEAGRLEPDGRSVPSPRAFLRGPLIRVLWASYRMRSLCGRETDTSRVISERADSRLLFVGYLSRKHRQLLRTPFFSFLQNKLLKASLEFPSVDGNLSFFFWNLDKSIFSHFSKIYHSSAAKVSSEELQHDAERRLRIVAESAKCRILKIQFS
ncbi:hypothetical protein AVEN_12588-1 [Araneus ventricosus]|uniref:Uncharacterized protein n=1 Tax=Araneus ventricosus TaxID=182803 RepID=A0A4Y2AAL0_ARAVE|nr:hypothetical protein AVEN_12588-1 [Araneus ventricosus]